MVLMEAPVERFRKPARATIVLPVPGIFTYPDTTVMKSVTRLLIVASVLAVGLVAWTTTVSNDTSTASDAAAEVEIQSVATDPPAVGDPAPDFTLVSNEGTEVSLTDYRDQWVVLYFYPKDFTGGCTIEAKNFERDMEQYEERNTVVLGVSVDSAESHQEFCTKEGLSFKLLSDESRSVSDSYGSLSGNVSARNTFVINPEGIVAKVFLKVSPNPHSQEVLAALEVLQAPAAG